MKRKPAQTAAEAPEFFSPQVSSARRFYLNLEPAAARGRSPSSAAAWNIARPTTKSTARRFRFISIEYVVRGEGA